MTKRKRGRPKKFKPGDFAIDKTNNELVVVVGHKMRDNHSLYGVVRMTKWRARRYGPVVWRLVQDLDVTNKERRGGRGSVATFRANKLLEEELGERGCECQCCIHYAIPKKDFETRTGRWKIKEDD